MPTRIYIGAIDEVEIHLSDGTERTVKRGELIEVSAEDAERLDEQPENFAPPKAEHKTKTRDEKDGDQ